MKNFRWRLRGNIGWFAAAIAFFTVIFIAYSYARVSGPNASGYVYCLESSPTVISLFVGFAFFMVYSKRYMYDEEYFYGYSRRNAFAACQCCAAVFALLLSVYASGVALLVRRSVLSATDMVVPADIYRISVGEIFCGFALTFTVNMLGFELTTLLRKFKSWKFWTVFLVCIAALVVLAYVFILLPMQSRTGFDYWRAVFSAFVPLLFIMIAGDFFMTRGRQ